MALPDRRQLLPSRRQFITALGAALLAPTASHGKALLPQQRTFIGQEKYQAILQRVANEQWHRLPLNQRIHRAGVAMLNTPYVAYTLEIDDSIEAPSVNFDGLDCWTFFEIALGLGRLTGEAKPNRSPETLLAQIEWTRYRGGRCHGHYLDRIHYLDEWFTDNQKRGNIKVITDQLGQLRSLQGKRRIDEMTVLWKGYRYLKHNPALLPGMREIEARLERVPFDYLPKEKVAAAEPLLQNGDIIGIVTHKAHVYCSHVGLAYRDDQGRCRFMHASSSHRRVLVDTRLSQYLNDIKSHAGIVVARPV